MNSRRGFLKLFGMGAALAPMAAVGSVIPKAEDKAEDPVKAFDFMCGCGQSVVAPVPKAIDAKVTIECAACNQVSTLTWKGNHFTFRAFPSSADDLLDGTTGPGGIKVVKRSSDGINSMNRFKPSRMI